MYNCPNPVCRQQDVDGLDRCRCGADLSLLQHLDAMADLWFNRALEEVENGDRSSALEMLSICCAFRPNDVEAHIVKAQLLGQRGHRRKALAALAEARRVEPENVFIADIEEALKMKTDKESGNGIRKTRKVKFNKQKRKTGMKSRKDGISRKS